MRRIAQLSMFCLAVGVVGACRPEQVVDTGDPPTAGVRFVMAVPDTGAMDFRPVDIVENSTFYQITFRSGAFINGGMNLASNIFYKNAAAGARKFRIFMNGTTAAIASTVVKEIDVTLEAGHNYTFILWGFARTGSLPAMKLDIIDDNPADPGAQVGLRVINAAAGLGAINVTAYPSATPIPATATWAGVAELTASSYTAAAAGQIRYNVTPAAGGAALADALALTGTAGTVDLEALPGTTLAGSAVTGIFFPSSVLQSAAPQGVGSSTVPSWVVPSVIFVWDRRPPRAPGT